MLKALTSVIVLVGSFAFATDKKVDTSGLDQALAPVQKSKGLVATIERVLTSTIMDTTKTDSGMLFVAQNSLRLEIEKPQKNLMVLNGKDLWLESHPEMGGPQVSHASVNKAMDAKIFVGLLGGDNWQKHFELKDVKKENDTIVYTLAPKKDFPDLKLAKLTMDNDNKKIRQIEYVDELDNKTSYKFQKIEMKTVPKTKFQYKKPKGAKVTELT